MVVRRKQRVGGVMMWRVRSRGREERKGEKKRGKTMFLESVAALKHVC